MKKIVLSIIVLMLLTGISSAYEARLTEDTVIAPLHEVQQVNISISSLQNERVFVTILNDKPWLTLVNSIPHLIPNKIETIPLYVSPLDTTQTGLYKIQVVFESEATKEKIIKDLFISVIRKEGIVPTKLFIQGTKEPMGTINIDVIGINYGSSVLDSAKAVLTIKSPSKDMYKKEIKLYNIAAGESKFFEHNIILERYSDAGNYTVTVDLKYNNRTSTIGQSFEVEKKPIIKQEIEEKNMMFGYQKTIKVTNYGNDEKDRIDIGDKLSDFSALFFSGDLPSTRNKDIYIWQIKNIQPRETRTLSYMIDYTSFVLFLIALVLLGWYVFMKLRTVRIKKYLMQKKMIDEGEEFTVGIDVKNAIGCQVKKLVIKDIVPTVFNIRDAPGPKPVKKRTAGGTELNWTLDNFNPREERVLSYKIYPVFGVHGTVRLPRACAEFNHKGKKIENISNFPSLGIEEKTKKRFLRKKEE